MKPPSPLLILAVWGLLAGCRRDGSPQPAGTAPNLATTTSYLEAVARALLGADIPLLRLAEPGTCPGHFDIRPSQVRELRRCRAMLRFDFQKGLDARFAGGTSESPVVVEIVPGEGLARPDHYLEACRQAADHFQRLGLLTPEQAGARLLELASRLDHLGQELTARVARAGLRGRPVIASARQKAFCEWLGLEVVAEFRPADSAGIREIESALGAGRLREVNLVIANRPEGRRVADALAERLGARVVVFDNFPPLHQGRADFDAMVEGNVRALLAP